MTITFKEKEYELTQDAYYNNGEDGVYKARAIKDGEEYMVYWDILPGHEDDENEDTMCDWDNPSKVLDDYGYEV